MYLYRYLEAVHNTEEPLYRDNYMMEDSIPGFWAMNISWLVHALLPFIITYFRGGGSNLTLVRQILDTTFLNMWEKGHP